MDGKYGCRALGNGLSCDTQVSAGTHRLEAKLGEKIVAETYKEVKEGGSIVWTVEPPKDPLAGRWSGQLNQPVGGSQQYYQMNMQIDSPNNGRTDYPSLACGGALSGGPTGNGSYSYQETVTRGRATPEKGGCIDGQITVNFVDNDTIFVSWSGSYQGKTLTASGNLKRQ